MNIGRKTSVRGRSAWLLSQQDVREGTIEAVRGSDNSYTFKVKGFDKPFDTIGEARQFMQEIGLTASRSIDNLGSGLGTAGTRMLRQRLGPEYSVMQQVFNFKSEDQLDALQKARFGDDGNVYGYMNTDQNQASVLRITKHGKELTTDEVTELIRSRTGTFYPFEDAASKVMKRAKTFMSGKRAEAIIRNPFVVSIVDEKFGGPDISAKTMGEARKIWDTAYDGISEISSHGLNLFIEANKTESQLLKKQLKMTTDPRRRLEIESSLRQVEDAIEEYSKVLNRKGGDYIANIRVQNFDLLISGQVGQNSGMADHLKEMRDSFTSIKGNIILSDALDRENAKRIARGESAIAMKTHYSNIKTDGGGKMPNFNLDKLRRGQIIRAHKRRSVMMTLESHHFGALNVDLQSLASYPEIFDGDFVTQRGKATLKNLQEDIAKLDKKGEIPESVKEMLDGMIKKTWLDGNPVVDESIVSTMEAQEILRIAESNGTLGANPIYKEKILRMLKEGATKKDLLRMRVPAGFRAEVIPRMFAHDRKLSGAMEKAGKGTVALDKSGGLLMHEMDAYLYHLNFGGFDFDDQLASMLRRTRDGKYKLLSYRNPLARGEWGAFDVLQGNEDYMLERMMEHWHDPEQQDRFHAIKRGIKEAEDMADTDALEHNKALLEEFKKQVIPEMPNIDDIPMRAPKNVDAQIPVKGGYVYEGEKGPFYYEKVDKSDGGRRTLSQYQKEVDTDLELRHLSSVERERIALSRFETKRFEQLITDVRAGDQLGRYVNARTMFDNFMAAHYDAIYKDQTNINRIKIYEMEDVVDALTGSSRDVQPKDIEAAINRMIDRVVNDTIDQRLAGNADVGLSKALAENRNIHDTIRAAFNKRAETDSDPRLRGLAFNDIFRPNEIDTWEFLKNNTLHDIFEEAQERVGFSEAQLNFAKGDPSQAAKDARRIIRGYSDVISSDNIRSFGEITGSVEDSLRAGRIVDDVGALVKDEVYAQLAGTFDEFRDDAGNIQRRAGRRTLEAVSELARIAEVEDKNLRMVFDNPVMTRLLNAVEEGSPEVFEVTEETLASLAEREVGRTNVNRVFRDILDESEYNKLRAFQYGIDSASSQQRMLTTEAMERLEASGGVRFMPVGNRLSGPLDPSMFVSGYSEDPMRMGEMVMRYVGGEEHFAEPLRELARNYMNMGEELAGDLDVDEGMARIFGGAGAQRAEHAADVAAGVTQIENKTNLRGLVSDVLSNRLGRGVVMGGFALAGIAGLNMFAKRDRDITPEEFQGPAYMPGGNPYQQPRPQTTLNPRQYTPQSNQGVTYEVRAKRGGDNDNFLNGLAGVTGGAVLSTIYGDSFEPDIDSILGDYR